MRAPRTRDPPSATNQREAKRAEKSDGNAAEHFGPMVTDALTHRAMRRTVAHERVEGARVRANLSAQAHRIEHNDEGQGCRCRERGGVPSLAHSDEERRR